MLSIRSARSLALASLVAALAAPGCAEQAPGDEQVSPTGSTRAAYSLEATSGYAWHVYTPANSQPPYTSYNSTGGVNAVNVMSPGYYQVDLPGLYDPYGNIQVVSYGFNNYQCKPYYVTQGAVSTTLRIYVRCFTPAGATVAAPFALYYMRETASRLDGSAYLRADSPTSASYTPTQNFQWTADTSSTNWSTVSRTGVGVYVAHLVSPYADNFPQVTAYGNNTNRCKVESWAKPSFPSHIDVKVRCFTAGGAPVDEPFFLNYMWNPGPGNGGAAVRADQPTTPSYSPSMQHNGTDVSSYRLASQVDRNTVGTYVVGHPFTAWDPSVALVTALGSGPEYCKPIEWWEDDGTGDTYTSVLCFNSAGSSADASFVQSLANTH